ncbi:hypothetical protein ACFLTD_05465 [Elusimicrobiota bacterium]
MVKGMNTESRPRFLKIISSDYISLLCVLTPVVCWGIYFFLIYFIYFPEFIRKWIPAEIEAAPFFFYLGGISLPVCIPVLLWRMRYINDVFFRGIEVKGIVANILVEMDKVKIELSYEFNGIEYKKNITLNNDKKTSAFKPGDGIVLLVNADDPGKCIIRDLYV